VLSNKLCERIKSFKEYIEELISSSVIEFIFKSFKDKQRRHGTICSKDKLLEREFNIKQDKLDDFFLNSFEDFYKEDLILYLYKNRIVYIIF